MTRVQRFSRLLAGMALVIAPATVALAPTSRAADSASGESDAVQQLGSCLASGKQGDLLLVLDTSLSLKQSDKDFARIKAATYLVQQFEQYATKANAKVDVAVAGFADKFEVSKGWTKLTRPAVGPIVSDLQTYRDRFGFETDYWAAATGARRYLDAKNSDGSHCQAWVWFSDGKFDLDQRRSTADKDKYGTYKEYGPKVELTSAANVDKVEQAGKSDLCRVGGIADALRSQGILTLAVGLRDGKLADFSLMEGVATGAKNCGRAPSAPSGQFVYADNIGGLFFAFDSLSDPNHPPITQTSPLCQGSVCPEGTHLFVLDASISKVHILAGAGVPNYRMNLYGPGHKEVISLASGDPRRRRVVAPAFSVTTERLAGDAVRIDVVRKRDVGWVGQWGLTFIDPASTGKGGRMPAKSNMHLYGDVEPSWLEAKGTRFTTGTSTKLTFGLVRAGETVPLRAADLASVISLDAAIEYADGTHVQIAKGLTKRQLTTPRSLSLEGATPGAAVVRATLRLTTANIRTTNGATIAGTQLEPQSIDFPVTIKAPPNFPSLPPSVSFGTTQKDGPLTASLPINGNGCVWLEKDASQTLPEGVRSVRVTSSASSREKCVSGRLPLTLTPSGLGAGLASGDLTVMAASDDAAVQSVPVTVRYGLEMQKPRNEKVFWPVLVGITLLGVLIPLGMLYLVKWRTSKFPGNSVLLGRATGQVDPQSSFLGSVALNINELPGITLAGGDRRSIQLNATSELRTRMGLGPTEPGYAVVVGQASASSAKPETTRRKRARLPLAIQDRWIALLDPTNPHTGPVEVIFLVPPTSQKLQELLVDARERVPDVVSRLRSRLGVATGPVPPSPTGRPQEDDWGNPVIPGAPGSTPSPARAPGGPSKTLDEW
jgi:hypothetical protein